MKSQSNLIDVTPKAWSSFFPISFFLPFVFFFYILLYYCCVLGACGNTKQGLLCGKRDLAHIHLVEPVQDLLDKQSGKHTFDKRVLNWISISTVYTFIIHLTTKSVVLS